MVGGFEKRAAQRLILLAEKYVASDAFGEAEALQISRLIWGHGTSHCGRRGRYNVAKLMEKYGDMKLPELRHVLANCPKTNAHSIHDRCKVRYGEDSRF